MVKIDYFHGYLERIHGVLLCSLLHVLQKMILITRYRGDVNINKNFGQFDCSKIKADTFKDTAKLKKVRNRKGKIAFHPIYCKYMVELKTRNPGRSFPAVPSAGELLLNRRYCAIDICKTKVSGREETQ